MERYLFPRWSNKVLPIVFFFVLGPGITAAVAATWYYGTDKHLSVGFEPIQPVEYSHKLHAGDMGMDCRYCHFTVEKSYMAAIPPTETCMNCHTKVRPDSVRILPVKESFLSDTPIPWVRIHNLPDYAYFNHSAHVAAGVACVNCHGRIDQMVRVRQVQPLTMGWCLDCHRNPAPNIGDPDKVTDMAFVPDMTKDGKPAFSLKNGRPLHPPTHCSGCHR